MWGGGFFSASMSGCMFQGIVSFSCIKSLCFYLRACCILIWEISWFVWAKMCIVVLSGSGVLLGHVFRDFSSSLFMYTATISGNYFVLANHSASRDSMSEEIGLEFKLCDFLEACVVAHCLGTLTLD
jgi:hypothetical protein